MTRRHVRKDRSPGSRSSTLRADMKQLAPLRKPLARPPSVLSRFVDTINLWIYRYNLNTALYMLEPWERVLFNSVVLAMLAYIVYGLYYRALHPLLERLAVSYM